MTRVELPSPRRFVAPSLVGVLVLIAGLLIFFILWAMADGIRPPSWAHAAFQIISFPIFAIAPKSLSTSYFWELAFLNGLCWAALAALLTWAWQRKSFRS
jgi:hypothetical protein